MQLLIDSHCYNDPPFVAVGGTAEIYNLGSDKLAKVFFETHRTFERQNKILALCNSLQNHIAELGASKFAFPEAPAFDVTSGKTAFAGFSMKDFGRIPQVGELSFDLASYTFRESGGARLEDASAIGLVYQIFEYIEILHRARIILGDVSDGNILYSPKLKHPIIIEIDSAQIGSFPCVEVTPAFMAPELKTRGTTLTGGLVFDAGTDVYAAAVICFQLLIGCNPNFVYLSPAKTAMENRDLGISSIRCFAMGRGYLSALGVAYAEVPENKAIERRLAWLQTKDRILYDFFVSVFVKGERDNLLTFLPVQDRRHPGYLFLVTPDFKDFLETLKKQRQQVPASVSSSPTSQPVSVSANPTDDFRVFIGALKGGTPSVVKYGKRSAARVDRSDPAELGEFLKQYNLSI